MTVVDFFVPGQPSAQGSKRHVGGGVMIDMNRNLAPWRDSITYAAIEAAQGLLNWRRQHGPVFSSYVRVSLTAVYGRPKSHYRTGSKANLLRDDAPFYKTSAPDADKLARAALDAVTASGLWRDDAQVTSLSVAKRYQTHGDATPGLYVRLWDRS